MYMILLKLKRKKNRVFVFLGCFWALHPIVVTLVAFPRSGHVAAVSAIAFIAMATHPPPLPLLAAPFNSSFVLRCSCPACVSPWRERKNSFPW
jgi:hypothetical protein